MADGASGTPDSQGAESREMQSWQREIGKEVDRSTWRLDGLNGSIEKLAGEQERIREAVTEVLDRLTALNTRLGGFEVTQGVIHKDTHGVDWRTTLAVVGGVAGPIAVAIIVSSS